MNNNALNRARATAQLARSLRLGFSVGRAQTCNVRSVRVCIFTRSRSDIDVRYLELHGVGVRTASCTHLRSEERTGGHARRHAIPLRRASCTLRHGRACARACKGLEARCDSGTAGASRAMRCVCPRMRDGMASHCDSQIVQRVIF